MKNLYTVLVFVFLSNLLFSQTTIPGGNVSGSWTEAGSPYLIQGPIQIPVGSVLTIRPGVRVVFEGYYKLLVMGQLLASGTQEDSIVFTAQNTSSGWRGIRFDDTPITNDSSKITYCIIEYAQSYGTPSEIHGGGIYLNNFSKVLITHSTIRYNDVSEFCGGNGGGICCINSSPVITHNIIYGNAASPICYGSGGGIYFSGESYAYLKNNEIRNNTASYGGGIFFTKGEIKYNSITYNTCNFNGGGISTFINDWENAYISNNNIEYNTANGWFGGGGIYSENAKLIIENNIIRGNISNSEGGGGLNCLNVKEIKYNFIVNNHCTYTNSKGGGIKINMTVNTNIHNNIIVNNYAEQGGGVFFSNGNGNFTNNVVANNEAFYGGGLYFSDNSDTKITNCILWGNTAIQSGKVIFLFDELSDPDFYNCCIENGITTFNTGGNFFQGVYSENIESNPAFLNPSAGSGSAFDGFMSDWTITNSSPCIDSGNPYGLYPDKDYAGFPRIMGCKIDIGAYEIQSGNLFTITITPQNSSDCFSNDGSAIVTTSGGVPPFTYIWSNNSSSSTVSNLQIGTYQVTVTDSNGCTRIGSTFISCPNNLSEQLLSLKTLIFPNPSVDGTINITIQNYYPLDIYIFQLFDFSGKLLFSSEIISEHTILALPHLNKGFYLTEIQSKTSKISRSKLIIQ